MVNMGSSGSGLLFCLTRPEALRAEAQMLHTMADWLDPQSDSEEDEPHRGQSLGNGAAEPLPSPLVRAHGPKHPGL